MTSAMEKNCILKNIFIQKRGWGNFLTLLWFFYIAESAWATAGAAWTKEMTSCKCPPCTISVTLSCCSQPLSSFHSRYLLLASNRVPALAKARLLIGFFFSSSSRGCCMFSCALWVMFLVQNKNLFQASFLKSYFDTLNAAVLIWLFTELWARVTPWNT